MVADQRIFDGFQNQPDESIFQNRIWRTIIYSFFFLLFVVWIDEIFDVPHLLFGAKETVINWREALSETFLIAIVGVFAVSRLFYTPISKKKSKHAFAVGNIWLPMAITFILLSFLIWLNELVDLPHILFKGESTPVNWIEASCETIIILGIGVFSVSLLIRNITERERAENRVRREKMFSNTLIQTSPIFFVAISPEGKTIMMNDAMLGVLDYTHDEISYKDYISTFIPEREYELCWEEFKEMENQNEVRHTERHVVTKNGKELLIEWYSRPIFTEEGNLDFIFSVGADITQRRHFEDELKNYQQQLRNLNIHLEQVREHERTRIARELHDELGQLLTVLKMDLAYVGRKLKKDEKGLEKKISDMNVRVDSTLNALKRIMTDLRPSMLDNLGLVAAIEWQAEDFQEHTGIECEVSVEPEDMNLDPGISTTVFRIFQETLTNVARHARADKVTVDLEKRENQLRLIVQDNGIGISSEKINDSKSYGIIGIRERVTYRGGDVWLTGRQGKGTTVSVTIPLDENSSNASHW